MNRPTSSLTSQDFVRLPADRSMADAIVRPSVSYWKDVLRRIRGDKVAMVSLAFLVLIILMGHLCPHVLPLWLRDHRPAQHQPGPQRGPLVRHRRRRPGSVDPGVGGRAGSP